MERLLNSLTIDPVNVCSRILPNFGNLASTQVVSRIVRGLPLIAVLLAPFASFAQQQPFLFHLTFRGTSYETNTAGEVVTKPVTEMSLLEDVAKPVGITDLSTLGLLYHIAGSPFGDTVEVVNPTNGAKLDLMFGFYFGSDSDLGRTALTNSSGTQERRVDQVYTKESIYALGSAFITKRYVTDTSGNVRATFDGEMHYLVRPKGDQPAKFVMGSFTTTRPFRPR